MGWLRNLLGFPDKIWEEAAIKLGGKFVQGKGLVKSEIHLLHRDVSIRLIVDFHSGSENSTQKTKAIPKVSLRPAIKLLLFPQNKGVLGSVMRGLLPKTGKKIDLPILGENYFVMGDSAELANAIFGHPDFIAALRGMSAKPMVCVGDLSGSWGNELLGDESEEDLSVSVLNVLKDVDELIAMAALTKVLLDLLVENDCVA